MLKSDRQLLGKIASANSEEERCAALPARIRCDHSSEPRGRPDVAAAAPVASTAVHEVVGSLTHGPELCPQEDVTSAGASEASAAAPQNRAEGCNTESEIAPLDLFPSATTQCAAAYALKAVPHDEDDDAAKSDSELC